ncbi:MAG: response regulator [Thermodesulfovibrionales bacterium]|nr:response regulator [Thermodesulfovibrionales bacterium]
MKKEDFTILIAEDDEIARDVLKEILKEEGYPVLTARDGLEAINLLRTEEIRLVITDLKMPGADGMEVLKSAKKINPEIIVVILTAYGTLDIALQAIKEGAYDYLAKPFKVEEIVFLAAKAFERAKTLAELAELRNILKETFRDIKLIKNIAKSGEPRIITDWIERIEKLKEKNIISDEEAEILKERLVRGDG